MAITPIASESASSSSLNDSTDKADLIRITALETGQEDIQLEIEGTSETDTTPQHDSATVAEAVVQPEPTQQTEDGASAARLPTQINIRTSNRRRSPELKRSLSLDKVLRIYSPLLINALRSVVEYYSSGNLTGRYLEFGAPFKLLVHHKKELANYMTMPRPEHTREYNEECDQNIKLLLDFLDNYSGLSLQEEEARWERKVPVTTFANLWFMLKPGEDVYVLEDGALNPYVIQSVEGGVDKAHRTATSYMITAWNIDLMATLEIRSLNVFPKRFYVDEEGQTPFEERLVERGKKFYTMTKKPAYIKYKRARVVIDHSYQPWKDDDSAQFSLPKVKFSDYDDIDPKSRAELSRHQYFLCAPYVYGYILKDHKWSMNQISTRAIDRLVMKDESNKNMIKAICQKYTQQEIFGSQLSADFIAGKGEGQIFLLHGPPGVGKTLTAEYVAEYTKRPLISITAGDLGNEPRTVEDNLDWYFRLGTDWEAIVLLDEADVYLETRTPQNLERNSIVSIFLRALEYYQGILFLTTNRVGSFDPAFSSRIHIQLHYPVLDDHVREEIWDNNFRKLREDAQMGGREIEYDYDAKEYVKHSSDVKALGWNGRELRNAFQTAVALAVYEAGNNKSKPILQEKHLKQVVRMSKAFKEYIKSTRDLDEAEMARELKIRDNYLSRN
ncbi:P-loop containing nucleoside triphosphate hydrolase protein [Thermoascus aurantiacus ATCC 26904]